MLVAMLMERKQGMVLPQMAVPVEHTMMVSPVLLVVGMRYQFCPDRILTEDCKSMGGCTSAENRKPAWASREISAARLLEQGWDQVLGAQLVGVSVLV
jgi:hypothetical protein